MKLFTNIKSYLVRMRAQRMLSLSLQFHVEQRILEPEVKSRGCCGFVRFPVELTNFSSSRLFSLPSLFATNLPVLPSGYCRRLSTFGQISVHFHHLGLPTSPSYHDRRSPPLHHNYSINNINYFFRFDKYRFFWVFEIHFTICLSHFFS